VVIRPATFAEKWIPRVDELFGIIARNSVELRGWDYPHVDRLHAPLQGEDWFGQELDWEDHIEVWRLYQSGLFLHYFAVVRDWHDQWTHQPVEPGWAPLRDIEYLHTIYELVEIFEFAARLGQSPAGASQMHAEIDLHGLENRQLVTSTGIIYFSKDYRTSASHWNYRWDGSQADLMARPRELAALAAQDLFVLFGLNVSVDVLNKLQQKIAR
jgi:hypothetical protein